MKRGDIVSVAGAGDFAGKPRPALIVQTDAHNDYHPSITVCPISTHLTGDHLFRVAITVDTDNKLLAESEVEVDKVQSVWRRRVGRHIGTATPAVMATVDLALKRWLDL